MQTYDIEVQQEALSQYGYEAFKKQDDINRGLHDCPIFLILSGKETCCDALLYLRTCYARMRLRTVLQALLAEQWYDEHNYSSSFQSGRL